VIGGNGMIAGTRDCDERWQTINGVLRDHECRSLVDLGCSEGFYVIQAAKSGLDFCVGVDFDLRRIMTCQSQVILNDIPHAAFLISEVTPELLDGLPKFDGVVFLSVLHHIMYQKGVEHCRGLMERLARKTGKALIFEMGQSDEHKESWAKNMPDMGSDPHAWIAEFLRAAGYASVEKIGEAESYLRETRRALFKALP
jgi:cyclopropane fatty-acyl-phospholipid synthase-like methyltransferase